MSFPSIIDIPQKSVFKLTEVCELTGVKPYVLRYWESEFDSLTPGTSASGQKIYEYKDIETILVLKKLLYTDKLTVDRARVELKIMQSLTPLSSQEVSEPVAEIPPALSLSRDEIKQEGNRAKLSAEELEKLALAKQKLQQLLSVTNSLKERHHWS